MSYFSIIIIFLSVDALLQADFFNKYSNFYNRKDIIQSNH